MFLMSSFTATLDYSYCMNWDRVTNITTLKKIPIEPANLHHFSFNAIIYDCIEPEAGYSVAYNYTNDKFAGYGPSMILVDFPDEEFKREVRRFVNLKANVYKAFATYVDFFPKYYDSVHDYDNKENAEMRVVQSNFYYINIIQQMNEIFLHIPEITPYIRRLTLNWDLTEQIEDIKALYISRLRELPD